MGGGDTGAAMVGNAITVVAVRAYSSSSAPAAGDIGIAGVIVAEVLSERAHPVWWALLRGVICTIQF